MKLSVEKLTCGYHRKAVIHDISLEVRTGETLCLLGPNGVGKTTFFRTLLGLLPPLSGSMAVNGSDLGRMRPSQRAKIMAYVPQAHEIPFPFTVEEVVVMGRHIHMKMTSGPTPKDLAVAEECMEELGIAHLREKVFTQISGGERQMVLIARALAQEACFLVMDEPASNLDFGNQVRVLNHIRRLREKNKGIIITTHSPDHAFLCGTRVAAFHPEGTMETGTPDSVITPSTLQRLYGVEALVHEMGSERGRKTRVCVPN